jgi:hypothetical protein
MTHTQSHIPPENGEQGTGPSTPILEDQYPVGDWDGDGRDNLAVRRGAM